MDTSTDPSSECPAQWLGALHCTAGIGSPSLRTSGGGGGRTIAVPGLPAPQLQRNQVNVLFRLELFSPVPVLRHRLLREPTSPHMKMEPPPATLQVLRQACIPLLGAVGLYPVDGCPVTAGQDDEVSTPWHQESMHSP